MLFAQSRFRFLKSMTVCRVRINVTNVDSIIIYHRSRCDIAISVSLRDWVLITRLRWLLSLNASSCYTWHVVLYM